MFIPIRTDRAPRRRPIVTESLIALNVLVLLAALIAHYADAIDLARFIAWMQFEPRRFDAWRLVTSMFMHDPHSIWHIAFNMLFLWVFGGPVEDRLGRAGFAAFYVMGGTVAGLAHMMVSPAPVIGASGAVAAVTGAYLALFPRSNIIVLWLFTLTLMPISSLWLIGLYFVLDVLRQAGEALGAHRGGVAYAAHIAGYVFGFALALVLLAMKVIRREEFDVFFLFTQARRRAAFRAANRGTPAGAWESASADTAQRLQTAAATPLTPQQLRQAELRSQINTLAGRDLSAAAGKYRELIREAPDAVFPEPRQLELANQLCADQDHADAARAYELLLARYPACARAAEVRLMLAVIYARHLGRRGEARALVHALPRELLQPPQAALADQLLAELEP